MNSCSIATAVAMVFGSPRSGRGGNDVMTGGPGEDRISAGAGDDFVSGGYEDDGIVPDRVRGPGRETAKLTLLKIIQRGVRANCERAASASRWKIRAALGEGTSFVGDHEVFRTES